MTPIEKANELYSKYDDLLNKDFGNPVVFDNQLKQCALIVVDGLIESTPSVDIYPYNFQSIHPRVKEYWIKVKEELELL